MNMGDKHGLKDLTEKESVKQEEAELKVRLLLNSF